MGAELNHRIKCQTNIMYFVCVNYVSFKIPKYLFKGITNYISWLIIPFNRYLIQGAITSAIHFSERHHSSDEKDPSLICTVVVTV